MNMSTHTHTLLKYIYIYIFHPSIFHIRLLFVEVCECHYTACLSAVCLAQSACQLRDWPAQRDVRLCCGKSWSWLNFLAGRRCVFLHSRSQNTHRPWKRKESHSLKQCLSLSEFGLTHRQISTLTHTFTPTGLRVTNSPDLHVFELLEETGALGGNPHKHWESMQTPHREDQRWNSNPGPEHFVPSGIQQKHISQNKLHWCGFIFLQSGSYAIRFIWAWYIEVAQVYTFSIF